MDELRSWALALCIACILCSAISMLFPDNSSKKLLNTVFSALVLLVLFKPLSYCKDAILRFDSSAFELQEHENTELEDSIASNISKIYTSYLEENLGRILQQNDIDYEKIIVNTDINEDSSISIGHVEVIVKNKDVLQSEKIKNLLAGSIGSDNIEISVTEMQYSG